MARRGGRSTIQSALALVIAAAATGVLADYPSATLPAAPSPLPALPSSFEPFSPPVSSIPPSSAAPALAEWTRSNGPGDTMVLTGSRLSAFSDARAGRDTRFVVFGQAGTNMVTADAAIQRMSGPHAAITLPAELPASALYLVWPKNESGCGEPAVLNRTEAWWIGPNQATAGDTVAVFGRNLVADDATPACWVYLQAASGSGRWLASASANPYKADFLIPADTAAGAYRAWVHNGRGQQLGWSGPLALTVNTGVAWNSTVFDVTQYGASGSDTSDDWAAIRAAMNAARAVPGSTVRFPRGTYLVTRTIDNIPPRVRVIGEGRDSSIIRPHPGFATDSYGLILGTMQDVVFRDLELNAGPAMRGPLGNNIIHMRGSARVVFDNVRFTQAEDRERGDTPIDIHDTEVVTFRNCEIIESGHVFLGTARQVFLEGCNFYGLNDSNSFIYEWGGREISIANCTAADYDSSDPDDGHGWSQGRFLTGNGSWGAMRNLYFGGNRTTDLTVRASFYEQNTGEQFMFEGLTTVYRGRPAAASGTTVRLADLTEDFSGQIMVVVGGTGIGQSREVLSFDPGTRTVTVDEPWRVTPDTGSTVMIGHYMSRMAVYGNTFDGKERAVTNAEHIASAGVEPFGGCVDLVVARNTFHQLRYGISNWSICEPYKDGRMATQPNFFNLFTDNRFVHCREGSETVVAYWQDLPVDWNICMLGNAYRRNHMEDLRGAAYSSKTWGGEDVVQMGVFDQNTGTNISYGAWLDTTGLRDQVWVRNRFSGRNVRAGLTLTADHVPALRGNTWEGLTPRYDGEVPGGVLEIPYRSLSLISMTNARLSGVIPIWNAGTGPLTWTAAATSSWLRVITSTGSVASESSAGAMAFEIIPTGLASTRHIATVAVSAAGKTLQVAIELKVIPHKLPPPQVSLTSPSTDMRIAAGRPMELTAALTDGGGLVTRVDFYAGNVLLGGDATSPYTCDWQDVPAGTNVIVARAVGAQGEAWNSEARVVEAVPLSAFQQWMLDCGLAENGSIAQDEDGDGIPLLTEYALGLDPAVCSRQGLPMLEHDTAAGVVNYVFTRARADLTYDVQRCTDLRTGDWTTVATNPGTVGERVCLPVSPGEGMACAFFRLGITRL